MSCCAMVDTHNATVIDTHHSPRCQHLRTDLGVKNKAHSI
jgi:hypothetical protein